MNVCDAMGANLMNQVLHWLKPKVEVLFQTRALMAILSNLQVYSLSNTTIKIYDTDRSKLERIVQAYQFAKKIHTEQQRIIKVFLMESMHYVYPLVMIGVRLKQVDTLLPRKQAIINLWDHG